MLHPDTAIVLTTIGRDRYELDGAGCVLARSDGPKEWDYSGKWKIVGFKTRHNANATVSLEQALDGADVGQGWVCDLDHGTHRMWGNPSNRRLGTIERVKPLRKHTRFETCERHRWLDGKTRYRRAEFFCEGGPADDVKGCRGGVCRCWPGRDLFIAELCYSELELEWVKPAETVAA